jgi:hypothetical protein
LLAQPSETAEARTESNRAALPLDRDWERLVAMGAPPLRQRWRQSKQIDLFAMILHLSRPSNKCRAEASVRGGGAIGIGILEFLSLTGAFKSSVHKKKISR